MLNIWFNITTKCDSILVLFTCVCKTNTRIKQLNWYNMVLFDWVKMNIYSQIKSHIENLRRKRFNDHNKNVRPKKRQKEIEAEQKEKEDKEKARAKITSIAFSIMQKHKHARCYFSSIYSDCDGYPIVFTLYVLHSIWILWICLNWMKCMESIETRRVDTNRVEKSNGRREATRVRVLDIQ